MNTTQQGNAVSSTALHTQTQPVLHSISSHLISFQHHAAGHLHRIACWIPFPPPHSSYVLEVQVLSDPRRHELNVSIRQV